MRKNNNVQYKIKPKAYNILKANEKWMNEINVINNKKY